MASRLYYIKAKETELAPSMLNLVEWDAVKKTIEATIKASRTTNSNRSSSRWRKAFKSGLKTAVLGAGLLGAMTLAYQPNAQELSVIGPQPFVGPKPFDVADFSRGLAPGLPEPVKLLALPAPPNQLFLPPGPVVFRLP